MAVISAEHAERREAFLCRVMATGP